MGFGRFLVLGGLTTVAALVSLIGAGAASAAPTPSFTAPDNVVAGTEVVFQSTSTPDGATPIDTYSWDFAGQGTCNTETCTVTAPPVGMIWTVTLTVGDINGTASHSQPIYVAPAPPEPPQNQLPTAAFAALPGSPQVGDEVTFVSYSRDPDGSIADEQWDLNGDGDFPDASGPIATRKFSTAGQKRITLRVTDNQGATNDLSLTLQVRERSNEQSSGSQAYPENATESAAPPLIGPTPLPSLLSPFPIVRLAGGVTSSGPHIDLLTVRAPSGARALVRCHGRGCPSKRTEKVVGRKPLRFRAFEGATRKGVVLEVLVRGGDRIGKFTRFKFRRTRRPLRTDGCLWPRTSQMAPCPKT
jgi:PKD repeat protein